MAPSIAIVKAGPINSSTRLNETSGSCGIGTNNACAAVAAMSAASGPGMRVRPGILAEKTTSAREAAAIAVVAGCRCGSACSRCSDFSWK